MIKFFRQNPEIFKEFSDILALPISHAKSVSLGEFEEFPVFGVNINDTLYLSSALLDSIKEKFPVTIKGYEISFEEYCPGEYDDQRIWEAMLIFSIFETGKNVLEEPIAIDTVEEIEFLN